MLLSILNLVFVLFVLCGWGQGFRYLLKLDTQTHWSTAVIYGWFPIAFIGLIGQILIPINLAFVGILYFCGIVLFVYFRKKILPLQKLEWVFNIFLALILVAFAVENHFYFDSANYHI